MDLSGLIRGVLIDYRSVCGTQYVIGPQSAASTCYPMAKARFASVVRLLAELQTQEARQLLLRRLAGPSERPSSVLADTCARARTRSLDSLRPTVQLTRCWTRAVDTFLVGEQDTTMGWLELGEVSSGSRRQVQQATPAWAFCSRITLAVP